MNKALKLSFLLSLVVLFSKAALTQEQTGDLIEEDEWWEESNVGLPNLIEQGWRVSFYEVTEDGSRREYLLTHSAEPGMWTCVWQRYLLAAPGVGTRYRTQCFRLR